MYDVTGLGELLIDFTYAGKSEAGMNLFEQNPGGAPANVLCLLANMGKKTRSLVKSAEIFMAASYVKRSREGI